MSPESVSPEQLAAAYWDNYRRKDELNKAKEPRPFDPSAGDRIIVEGDGWSVTSQTPRPGEPDKPETGLEWAWDMVNHLACDEPWEDLFAADEQREPRFAPSVDRLALIELLADRAPDDGALGFLGADALEEYLRAFPDVDAVDRVAQRNARFRKALASVWYYETLSPEDIARLRRRSSES